MLLDYLCTCWEWVIACIWEWCLRCLTALIRYLYKVIILLRITWSNGHVRIPCCQVFDLVTLVPNSCSHSLYVPMAVLCSKLFAFFVRAISALVTLILWIFVSPLISLTYLVWAALLGMLNIQKQVSEWQSMKVRNNKNQFLDHDSCEENWWTCFYQH